eukprot:1151725-Pelagomonas_calceolata.AAC.3
MHQISAGQHSPQRKQGRGRVDYNGALYPKSRYCLSTIPVERAGGAIESSACSKKKRNIK